MTEFNSVFDDMKRDRDIAKRYVLDYENEKYSYEFKRAEYLESKREFLTTQRSMPASPTEAIAVANAQYDKEHPEYCWLKAVELAFKTFGERKHIFIEVRREAEKKSSGNRGRKGWVIYTQRRYSEEIQKRFVNDMGWLGERTVKSWWSQIIDCVVEIHLRLVKIYN